MLRRPNLCAPSLPHSVATLCLFLCSEAATTLTGATLSMDGGWVAH